MSESRYVRKVYNMMRHDDSPDNWVGKIEKVLYRYNFVHIWKSQLVVNKNIFLRNLWKRMITVSNTKWLNILYGSDRYNIYRMFKRIRYKEPYFNVVDRITNKKTLTFFRMEVSSFLIHRSLFITNTLSVCTLCNEHEKMVMERNEPLMIHKLSLLIYYDLKRRNDYISETVVVNI